MPRKNTVKKFIENGFYHIYNRGVEGREIFLDEQDYKTFLSVLKRYLAPFSDEARPGFKSDRPSVSTYKQRMNLNLEVNLLAYCLMPNHFHLLVRQNTREGITKLMRRVCTNYAMYFNKKYGRKGTLFESIYKAVMVESEVHLLHLTRYIHLNPVSKSVRRFGPVETITGYKPEEYEYSSYRKYLGMERADWFDPGLILAMFGKNADGYNSYRGFVEDYRLDSREKLGVLVLEGD